MTKIRCHACHRRIKRDLAETIYYHTDHPDSPFPVKACWRCYNRVNAVTGPAVAE